MNIVAALCIDRVSCADPMLVGLAGERLEKQSWLAVLSNGTEARRYMSEHDDVKLTWVVSCDDVEPINLAAALKGDRPDMHVVLVHPDVCGSVLSRAYNAHVDEVVGLTTFVREYGETKGRCAAQNGLAAQYVDSRASERVEVPRAQITAPVENRVAEPDLREMAMQQVNPSPSPYSAYQERTPDLASAHVVPVREAPAVTAEPADLHSASTQKPVERELVDVRMQSETDRKAAPAKTPTFVLPVVGGSGGVGKSAVSVVAAYAAHRRGYKTLLVDYDLQFGDMAHLSGAENPIAIDEAFAHPELAERESRRVDGPVVVSAPAHLDMAEMVVEALPVHFPTLISSFDVVIVNTGAAWAEQHAALLERSSAALFLVDQRASSVRACKRALDLCTRCGIATGPFKFAVNRCSKNSPLTSIDVSCALQGVPVFELKDGGRDVEELLGVGAPNQLIDSRNDFCVSLVQMLIKLLPENAGSAQDSTPDQVGNAGGRRNRHGGRRKGRGRS